MSTEDKIREKYFRWFGHVQRRPIDAPYKLIVKRVSMTRDRCKRTWILSFKEGYDSFMSVAENMILLIELNEKKMIRVTDPINLG